MEVRLFTRMAGKYGSYHPGETADLPESVARHLIATHQAEIPVEPDPAVPDSGETAAVEPQGERAAVPDPPPKATGWGLGRRPKKG